ncbi:hypothetical protein [Halegenticoccus tardaugens]|nr:hypothetical protein [Halegenticoccus tardaugens]
MSPNDWPRTVGDHRVTDRWVCEVCGADFDCLSQFRETPCER